jgi:Transglutaminase-like superfamily
MRSCLHSLIVLSLCTSPALAQGKILLETWDAAYLGDGKAGYIHTIAKEIEQDGKKLVHTTVELRLTVKRFNDTVQMSMDTGSIESPDGKVTGVFMKQFLGKKQQLQVDGAVVGKQIELKLNGMPLKPAPWNHDVLGLYKQQSVFRDRDIKPGDTFTYLSFEPSINLVLKTEVVAKGYREVEIKGNRGKKKLLLVETVPEKVDFKRGDKTEKIQLPAMLAWLDEKLEPVKSEVEIPGLGPIVMYRVSKEQALAPGPVAQLTDIGINQLVRLKNRILSPYETTAAVYRITIRNDDNVATTFSSDARQQVKNVKGNTFELHVKASKGLKGEAGEKEPADEFTQSSYFINSADAKVKELARKAVGAEADPWKKALRIERWVHANMKVTADEALATADHVARTLEGDCTEFAMLTAAMCRAEGVPSRTAIGLIYAEPADAKRAPCFAFHMWTEVWISGRWIPIDATLGKGYVGATHLKITDHSWHDERTMTPIFPVIRVVGRVNIEVLSAENR